MIDDAQILKTTCIIFAFIFGGASLLTFAFRKTNWGRNIIAAILMWLVIFCLFMFTAYAGWLVFAWLIVLLAYGAIREFYTINGILSKTTLVIAALSLLLMAAALRYDRIDLFHIVPLVSALLFLPVQMCRQAAAGFNRTVALQVLGLVYWGWMPMHFLLIHQLPGGFGAIVLLCTLIALNDNGAYYTGKLLGANSPKFLPAISPGKTWTGFIGGGIITVLVAGAFQYAVPTLHLWQRLVLGLIVAVMGPIGDLLESAMKRDAGVKDSGYLIPGHGGVMDRFDSWSFTAPLYYYFLVATAWL